MRCLPCPPSLRQAGAHDRFIPNRSAMHMEKAHYALSKENSNPQGQDEQAPSVATQDATTAQKKGE